MLNPSSPESSPTTALQRVALALLRGYKRFISPLLPPACRFQPTCSEYAAESVQYYGVMRGIWMALCRLLRCHPFHRGGFDPVPVPGQPEISKPHDTYAG